jgi:hypothetical protein
MIMAEIRRVVELSLLYRFFEHLTFICRDRASLRKGRHRLPALNGA